MPQLTINTLYSLTQTIKQKIDVQTKNVSDLALTIEQKEKLTNFNKWQEKAENAIIPHMYGVEVDERKIETIKTDISNTYPDSEFNVGTNIMDFIRLTINNLKSYIYEAINSSHELRQLSDDLTLANSYLHSMGENGSMIYEESGLAGLLTKYIDLDHS